MADPRDDYWPRLLCSFRRREGLTQAMLAESLSIDQSSVSRWERGIDQPALPVRRQLRDRLRRSYADRQDRAMRCRIRHSGSPHTLVRRGAVFLEANNALLRETRIRLPDLCGRSIYGSFGDETDHVTRRWEGCGMFEGDMALCITVNALRVGPGPDEVSYVRSLDTPYFSTDDGIWSMTEVQVIGEGEYRRFLREHGGPIMMLPFDNLS